MNDCVGAVDLRNHEHGCGSVMKNHHQPNRARGVDLLALSFLVLALLFGAGFWSGL
jgi:hypothetical protein